MLLKPDLVNTAAFVQVNPGKSLYGVNGSGHWFSPGTWEDGCLWESNQALKFESPHDFKTNNSPVSGSNQYDADHFSVVFFLNSSDWNELSLDGLRLMGMM